MPGVFFDTSSSRLTVSCFLAPIFSFITHLIFLPISSYYVNLVINEIKEIKICIWKSDNAYVYMYSIAYNILGIVPDDRMQE